MGNPVNFSDLTASEMVNGGFVCPYCYRRTEFHKDSSLVYSGRNFGPVYACLPCGAWVGCHPGTERALGRLADVHLRAAKRAAHAAFDPLWKGKMAREGISKSKARGAGYAWLARMMEIPIRECHIGMFTIAQCDQVVEICKPWTK